MRLASLGSGSKGNATLVAADDTLVLVDCGFTIRETEQRLARLNVSPTALHAILVTHEHADHIRGVAAFARKHSLPVYASFGTIHAVAESRHSLSGLPCYEVRPGRRFALGALSVLPVPVPHDAREPCQFVFNHGNRQCGVLTDLGSITPHLVEAYRQCDVLLLECNHDLLMLQEGPYPPSLKRRVAGMHGHLNNHQAAEFLAQIDHQRLQCLVLSHLSEQNNHPDLALGAVEQVCGKERVRIASQTEGFGWLDIQ